jgi:DNA polymerase III alpha subunit
VFYDLVIEVAIVRPGPADLSDSFKEKQRLDLIAVRAPAKAILGLAAAVAEHLTQQATEKSPKTAKK